MLVTLLGCLSTLDCHQHPILLRIVSFHGLGSLVQFRLLNHQVANLIITHEEQIFKQFLLEQLFVFSGRLVNYYPEYLMELLGDSSYRDLLKDFYEKPIENISYDQSDNFKKYLSMGGVVRITVFEPCKLLKVLLKIHFDAQSLVKSSKGSRVQLHKFPLICSLFPVLGSKSLKITETQFNRIHGASLMGKHWNQVSELILSNMKIETLTLTQPGALLMWMYNQSETEEDYESSDEELYMDGEYESESSSDEEDMWWHQSNNTTSILHKELSIEFENNHTNPNVENILKYHWISNKPHEEDNYRMCDIFRYCARPPDSFYLRQGLQEKLEQRIEMLRAELYNNFDRVHTIDWSSTLSRKHCWSIQFQAGLEWWGAFAFTTYNMEKEWFIVATASESL